MRQFCQGAIGLILIGCAWLPSVQAREWTSSHGTKVEAELVDIASGVVILKKADGADVTIQMDALSQEDRAFVEDVLSDRTYADSQGRIPWGRLWRLADGSKIDGKFSRLDNMEAVLRTRDRQEVRVKLVQLGLADRLIVKRMQPEAYAAAEAMMRLDKSAAVETPAAATPSPGAPAVPASPATPAAAPAPEGAKDALKPNTDDLFGELDFEFLKKKAAAKKAEAPKKPEPAAKPESPAPAAIPAAVSPAQDAPVPVAATASPAVDTPIGATASPAQDTAQIAAPKPPPGSAAKASTLAKLAAGLGLVLGMLGSLTYTVASLWILVLAFKESIVWGIVTFFSCGIGGLVFCVTHFAATKTPLLVGIGGVVIAILGGIVSLAAAFL